VTELSFGLLLSQRGRNQHKFLATSLSHIRDRLIVSVAAPRVSRTLALHAGRSLSVRTTSPLQANGPASFRERDVRKKPAWGASYRDSLARAAQSVEGGWCRDGVAQASQPISVFAHAVMGQGHGRSRMSLRRDDGQAEAALLWSTMKRTVVSLVLASTAFGLQSSCSSDGDGSEASPRETVTVTESVPPTELSDKYAGAAEPCMQSSRLAARTSQLMGSLTQPSDAATFFMNLAGDYRELAQRTASWLGPGSARVGALPTQIAQDADDLSLGYIGSIGGTTSRQYLDALLNQLSDDMAKLFTYCDKVKASS